MQRISYSECHACGVLYSRRTDQKGLWKPCPVCGSKLTIGHEFMVEV